VQVNKQACLETGYTEEELLSLNVVDIDGTIVTREAFSEFTKALSPEKTTTLESTHIRKDGSSFPVEITISRLTTIDGTFIIGIARNITERRQLVTERRQLEEHLRQTEKMNAIGQLAGGIAHDFNNQLSGILGYADFLSKRLTEPKLNRFAENIKRGAKRAADLTAQLLAFSRKGKFFSIPVDVHNIIDEIVSILNHSIDKRINVIQKMSAENSISKGDPTQIQNALLNLGLNARDAMPEGGELRFETCNTALDEDFCNSQPDKITPGEYICISVSDTGCGMSLEIQNRIFEPFFTTKEQGKGTGMGLASAYGTICTHNGTIKIQSEENKGSIFQVYLPASDKEVKTTSSSQGKLQHGSANILLVDDEEIIRELAEDLLHDLGYNVNVCENGQEAIEYYEKNWQQIDLVILDMVMPEVSGKDTFTALKKINPEICAVLSSGYSINGEAQKILDQGVKSFIGKPFDEAQLSETISEVLKNNQKQK
ncbi:MAG: response regulator, partial [Planctomycetota bacterium]|jgi:PAS domain S-box-containing protein